MFAESESLVDAKKARHLVFCNLITFIIPCTLTIPIYANHFCSYEQSDFKRWENGKEEATTN